MVNLMAEKKALVIVEGEKDDYKLLEKAFQLFLPAENRKIVSYGTNIYELYTQMENVSTDWDELDFLQVLKAHENDEALKSIFDEDYTDILLVFDFDPQDNLYNSRKLCRLMDYFCESTENGRLYLNYPMVESFYHITSLDDDSYMKQTVSYDELRKGLYKSNVDKDSFQRDLRKYSKEEMKKVIFLNVHKAQLLNGESLSDMVQTLRNVLDVEVDLLRERKIVQVLNTCILFMYEYKSADFS